MNNKVKQSAQTKAPPATDLTNLGQLHRRLVSGGEQLLKLDEVEVGTTEKDLVDEFEKAKLYRYRRGTPATAQHPVLLVYALINREYLLDLQPDRSLVRGLLDAGLDVYAIEWGYPQREDQFVTLDDYIDVFIDGFVETVLDLADASRLHLVGTCQGGTLSVIYSALNPEVVRSLTTLVAPVDFETDDGLLFTWSKHMNVDKIVDTFGVVPGSFLNSGFMNLKPYAHFKKYKGMLEIMDDPERMQNFMRMEKWLFDNPGQSGEAFRRFIKDLYQENKLVKDELEIHDRPVSLKNIKAPLLNIYGTRDHIIPAAACVPLNDKVGSQNKKLLSIESGHLGVFVSSRAQSEVAPAITGWMHEHDSDLD